MPSKDRLERPNVVVVVLEQCKASALSCYGNDHTATPNIDRVASQGVLFTNSFTTFPKCVPARCGMMTGRYPHVEGHRTLPGFQIRPGENNLPAELKKNGYTCVLAGKNNTVEKDSFDECFSFRLRSEWGKPVRKGSFQSRDDPNLFRAQYRDEKYQASELGDSFAATACGATSSHATR